MQHVAFLELMGSRGKDMLPCCIRIDMDLCQNILQLVAKTESAARLIKARAGADAGAERLVRQRPDRAS